MPLNWQPPDKSKLTQIQNPIIAREINPGAPALPQFPPDNNPFLRSSLPLFYQYQPDALRQWFQRNVTQFRVINLPPNAGPAFNSGVANTK